MKLIAEILYTDSCADEPYSSHQVIPFEAESWETGFRLIEEAVTKDTVFGTYYGVIGDGQALEFKVQTFEEWFESNKKEITTS